MDLGTELTFSPAYNASWPCHCNGFLGTWFSGLQLELLGIFLAVVLSLRTYLEEIINFFSFPEREENVKADIFTAYRALLTRSKPSSQKQQQLVGEGEAMEVTDRSVRIRVE